MISIFNCFKSLNRKSREESKELHKSDSTNNYSRNIILEFKQDPILLEPETINTKFINVCKRFIEADIEKQTTITHTYGVMYKG